MRQTNKAQVVPPSGSSEPSEPSEIKPEDKSREQLAGAQEENPQLMMHKPGMQAGDANAGKGDKALERVGYVGSGYTGDYEKGRQEKGKL